TRTPSLRESSRLERQAASAAEISQRPVRADVLDGRVDVNLGVAHHPRANGPAATADHLERLDDSRLCAAGDGHRLAHERWIGVFAGRGIGWVARQPLERRPQRTYCARRQAWTPQD